MGLENIFYLENFDCPTDEIVVKTSPVSPSGAVVRPAMSARLAGQVFQRRTTSSSSSGSVGNNVDPLDCSREHEDDSEGTPVVEEDQVGIPRDVIVIPSDADAAQLQQAIQQVSANGVTVLDVRSLRGGSGRSSPGSEHQVAVVQAAQGQHYIAVPGTVARSYASLTTVNPVGDGGGVGYHVQYVEPQELYNQSQQGQTQMSYPVYSVTEASSGGNVYGGGNNGSNSESGASNSTAHWNAYIPSEHTSTSASTGSSAAHHFLLSGQQVDVDTAPQLHRSSPHTVQAEVAYLSNAVGSGGSGSGSVVGEESAAQQAAHAARTSPATVSQFTVQWLLENYENADGVSLPRSTLYNHYLRHCGQRDLEPVNAASFGKLIRSVFLGLRTRRLGTRGNSKYHYYGIRVKPGSSLSNSSPQSDNINAANNGVGGSGGSAGRSSNSRFTNRNNTGTPNHQRPDSVEAQTPNAHMHQHHQYLGDGNGAIPDFPEIQFLELPGECTVEDVDTLRSIYREHCEAFLDAVLSLELSTVESLWREFWRQNNNNDSDECEEEKYLSKTKLYQLCGLAEVQTWVRTVDVAFYQRLVQVLLPDVLRPIPSPLTQAIRNFAKGMESWLVGAMVGCPAGMVRAKATPASALAQSLRRYTSLNHLAQAARAVLHNSQQIHQMLADLNRVDFHNVQEQASWVCQCPGGAVWALEADFKRTLQRQASLEQWAAWLEAAVRKALRPHERSPHYAHHARQFLLKWSFYSSMVIRDLTLRSAASFGSFHLIRLLYDEYMFYLIEHRVAAHQGSAPIQVMAEKDPINGSLEPEDLPEENAQFNDLVAVPMKCESPSPPKKIKIS